MLKRSGITLLASLLALSLCACGSSGGSQQAAEPQAEEAAAATEASEPEVQEFDPMVDCIDMSLEGGDLRFDHVEKANDGLVTAENAYVFVFDFTNKQDTPSQAQSVFYIQFYQNGVELNNSSSYSSQGGDQYDLVSAFFSSVMKGGTVTFGEIVEAKDNSPITVMVSPMGALLDDNYQMMEVPLDSNSSDDASTPSTASAEDVDAALQGTWDMGADGQWTFDQGSVTFNSAVELSGTYEVDADSNMIVMYLEASDGTVKATLPFEFDGQALKLFKNSDKAEELIKL